MPKDIRYLKGVGEKRRNKDSRRFTLLFSAFSRGPNGKERYCRLCRGRNGVREHYRFFACQRNKSKKEYAYFYNDCIGRIGCFECGLVQ